MNLKSSEQRRKMHKLNFFGIFSKSIAAVKKDIRNKKLNAISIVHPTILSDKTWPVDYTTFIISFTSIHNQLSNSIIPIKKKLLDSELSRFQKIPHHLKVKTIYLNYAFYRSLCAIKKSYRKISANERQNWVLFSK